MTVFGWLTDLYHLTLSYVLLINYQTSAKTNENQYLVKYKLIKITSTKKES